MRAEMCKASADKNKKATTTTTTQTHCGFDLSLQAKDTPQQRLLHWTESKQFDSKGDLRVVNPSHYQRGLAKSVHRLKREVMSRWSIIQVGSHMLSSTVFHLVPVRILFHWTKNRSTAQPDEVKASVWVFRMFWHFTVTCVLMSAKF